MPRFTLLLLLVLTLFSPPSLPGLTTASALDSDNDGLSDALEAGLLARYAPDFMVSRTDCAGIPAQFVPTLDPPAVLAQNGTIYGQAFLRRGHPGEVELHYYHLWQSDCGEWGHALDTEHVSALIRLDPSSNAVHALYWYASAHEDTICDASQLARASTLNAVEHGPTVWISNGKHASFLAEALCAHTCGADRCERMKPVKVREIVNLGELGAPMNHIAWLRSPAWPLQEKMQRSDFTAARIARLQTLPATDVVWANPAKRPAQATILGMNAGIGGAATGARATNTALVVTDADTGAALGAASSKTGNALRTSTKNVWKALKKSADSTGNFLDPGRRQ